MLGLERLLPEPTILKPVQGADPVAGAEVAALTVPAGKYWLLLGVSVALVQGLTQTPWPALVIDDGTNIVHQLLSGTAAQSVSTTTQHSWAPDAAQGGGAGGAASVGTLPAPMIMLPGWRVRTLTGGIGANSNYGVPTFYYAEYGT